MKQENTEPQGDDISINMDIDMDALVASDSGVADTDTSIPGQEPGFIAEPNDMTDPNAGGDGEYISKGGLDNLDEAMNKELGVESENKETDFSSESNESWEENTETNTSNEEYTEVPYYNAPFDELKERLGDDFQMPDDVTEDNYMDKLLDVVYKNTNFDEYVHPDVRELNTFMKNGGELDDYVNKYVSSNNMDQMSNHDLVRARLKGESPDWSDEQVNTVLTKMNNSGILDVEASRLRKGLAAEREGMSQRMLENQNVQREASARQVAQEREEQINEAVSAFNGVENVYGLPVRKAERQDFKETFTKLVTPDENGKAPLMEMLQSNETLAKVAYILSKGDSAVRSALTNAKESTKDAFMEKLDPSPKTIAKSGSDWDPGKVNLDALSAPERYRH